MPISAAATLIANDFERAEQLIPVSPAEKADQPSREELALFRMKRALSEEKFEWRTIHAFGRKSSSSRTRSLDVLRGDPDVEFGRSKAGKRIARLRNPDRIAQ